MRARHHLGLLMLVLTGGAVGVAGCGDDSGTSSNGGGAAQVTGGASGSNNSAGKGSGHAGTVANAGVSAGGTSSGGKTGSGGASCEIQECFRANVCLDKCGGKVVASGCCACVAPTVDELTCDATGGQGGGTSSDCFGTMCETDQTCVAYRTVGGAQILPDAGGSCPTGKHVEGGHCLSDFAYTCAGLTGCNAPATTCHCAAGSKCASANACRLPSDAAWLDADAELVCEQQAP